MLFVRRRHAGNLRQTANGMFHVIWRRKIIFIATSIFIVVLFIVTSRTSVDKINERRYYEDELLTEYRDEDKSIYNNENTSMFDPGLLDETRKRWIVFKHDNSMGYNLQNPDLLDQSMGQGEMIRKILNDKTDGFFIECGAYDGETRSNTLYLERYLNWTGLLIEADPTNFAKLVDKNRRSNLSNTCLSTEVYPKIDTFLLADNIGRLHTPNELEFLYVENTLDVAYHGPHIQVQCLPLATYVAALGVKQVDYFSLDIEGLEQEVLKTVPFHSIDIKTLSVEFKHNKESLDYLTNMMEERGYEVAGMVTHPDNLANDVIFVKKDSQQSYS